MIKSVFRCNGNVVKFGEVIKNLIENTGAVLTAQDEECKFEPVALTMGEELQDFEEIYKHSGETGVVFHVVADNAYYVDLPWAEDGDSIE